MATETLNIIITTKTQGDGAQKAETGLKGLKKAAKLLAGAFAAIKSAQFLVDLGKLGIASQAASLRFERFAGSAEDATQFLEAFNKGSQGTVDRMTAMSSASRLLQMGLVETGDEMTSIAAMATRLGDQTMAAGDRISDFAAMLANQSIPRLDNFGISSGRVRARIDELLESGQALNREAAFKLAVMEEGAKALERLGDTTDTTAHKIDVLTAAFADAKTGVAELLVEFLGGVGAVDGFAERVRMLPDTMRQMVALYSAGSEALNVLKRSWNVTDAIDAFENSVKRSAAAMADFRHESEITRYAHQGNTEALEVETGAISSLSYVSDEVKAKLKDQVVTQGMLEHTVLAAAAAMEQEAVSVDQVSDSLGELDSYLFDASMSFTEFYRRQEESAERYNQSIEEAEAKHQEKLAKLAEQGQAQAVRIDVAAEEEKLNALRRNLEIALQQQAEFTGKTKQSTQMRKADQISSLQGQIAEQESLLDNYHAGRLVKAGRNVDALIEEENRRYAAEIEGLKNSQAEQEAEQKRSLGRMVLQHFNSWAEMQGLTAEETLQMQLDISEKYGLIEEDAAQHVLGMANTWQGQLNVMRGESLAFTSAVKDHINSIPSAKTVTITYKTVGSSRQTEQEDTGPVLEMQHGGYSMGGLALVGERGPELVSLPRGARVYSTGQSQQMMGSVNIGPVYITGESPEVIWRKLENYARLKGKSGWQQLGR